MLWKVSGCFGEGVCILWKVSECLVEGVWWKMFGCLIKVSLGVWVSCGRCLGVLWKVSGCLSCGRCLGVLWKVSGCPVEGAWVSCGRCLGVYGRCS
ncbi:hypothetical protein ACOMHN_035931 [Nucella lapillus]